MKEEFNLIEERKKILREIQAQKQANI